MTTTLDWYGCATFRLRTAELTIFLDAYIDRAANAAGPHPPRRADDVEECDWVIIGHAHFDHLYGAERIMANTAATLIGSYESVRMMADAGVPIERMICVAGGESIELGNGVTVSVYPSQHSCVWSHTEMHAADEVCIGDLGVNWLPRGTGRPTATSARPSPLKSPAPETASPTSDHASAAADRKAAPQVAKIDRRARRLPEHDVRRRHLYPSRAHDHVRAPVAVDVADARDLVRRGRIASRPIDPEATATQPLKVDRRRRPLPEHDVHRARERPPATPGERRATRMSARPSAFTSPAPATACPPSPPWAARPAGSSAAAGPPWRGPTIRKPGAVRRSSRPSEVPPYTT